MGCLLFYTIQFKPPFLIPVLHLTLCGVLGYRNENDIIPALKALTGLGVVWGKVT